MDTSNPPELAARVADLERQLRDLQRAQNPIPPDLFDLNDISGQPSSSGMVMEYDRSSGEWRPNFVLQPGDIKWTASNAVPFGRWLLADGAAVSRSTYDLLFTEIGTDYGAGDGSSTFNLPNLTGRMVITVGGDALGDTGGARTHTLNVGEIPGHTHAQVVTADTGGGSAIRQDYDAPDIVNGGTFAQGASTGSTGLGFPHNNMPPYIALYAYVRY